VFANSNCETYGALSLELENAIEKRTRSWIVGWVVGILISLAALVVAFWGVQPGRFLSEITQANYIYLIPSALLLLLGLLARARSWQVLLGDQVNFGRAFSALNEGYLLNNVLPLRLGELGRAYMVSQEQPIGPAKALATVVMERIIDVVVSLAGLLLALPFVVAPQWARDVAWAAGSVLVAGVFLLAMLLIYRGLLLRIVRRLPGRGFWRIGKGMEKFLGGLEELVGQPKRILLAAFWSIVAWLTTWVELWLLLAAFGARASPIVPLFTSGVTAFGAALPSFPGALGVYELSTVAGLLVFSYSRDLAVGAAVVAHGLVLALTSLLGAWALTRDGQTIVDLAGKAQALFRGPPKNVSS
jgi:uncharacterized protein (TIRG00374 family)